MSESGDRAVQVAARLLKLGVSHIGVVELITNYSLDEIERQLDWLQYRKAKRPGAFVINAIRNRYSAPKEIYASHQAQPTRNYGSVDQSAQQTAGQSHANAERHGTQDPPDSAQTDHRVEPTPPTGDIALHGLDEALGTWERSD